MGNGLQMRYFVLKPKGKDAYARASRAAMFRYSLAIMGENPELSRELLDWASLEWAAAECDGENPPYGHPDFINRPAPAREKED